jgi:membrane protease YdiL (CAAX protease family)
MILFSNLTYLLLLLCVICSFFAPRKKLVISMIVITNLYALLQGTINFSALFTLIVFYLMSDKYFNSPNISRPQKNLLFIVILCFIIALSMHQIGGFYNLLIANKLALSSHSAPYTMYLNFDKTMGAVILYVTSGLYKSQSAIDREVFFQTIKYYLLCIVTLLGAALLMNFVRFDFKIPANILIWSINNLFFVCFAEEVIFRGILQNQLKNYLQRDKIKYFHVIISAMLFALAHSKGGVVYVSLAFVAGLFYGISYDKTNRILTPILVHFGLNLTHFLFFTYPFAIDLINY